VAGGKVPEADHALAVVGVAGAVAVYVHRARGYTPLVLETPFTRSGRPQLSFTLKMLVPPRFIAPTARNFETLSGMLPVLAYQRL
jgi:hypothetical protein